MKIRCIISFVVLLLVCGCQHREKIAVSDKFTQVSVDTTYLNNVVPVTTFDEVDGYVSDTLHIIPNEKWEKLDNVTFGLLRNKRWLFYSMSLKGNVSTISVWEADSSFKPRTNHADYKLIDNYKCFKMGLYLIEKTPTRIFDFKDTTTIYNCEACHGPIVYYGYSSLGWSKEVPNRICREFYINNALKSLDAEIDEFGRKIEMVINKLEQQRYK